MHTRLSSGCNWKAALRAMKQQSKCLGWAWSCTAPRKAYRLKIWTMELSMSRPRARAGGGVGVKHPDLLGAYCCSACHDEVDRRTRCYDADKVRLWFLEGMART